MSFKDEEQIRIIISKFTELYRQDLNRWQNERCSHYDFFKLLFNTLEPIDIRNNFKWEYLVGVPSYGKGKKEAAVDIIYLIDNRKWVAIEIELVGPGKKLENELKICISKLQTAPLCRQFMVKGYVVPLLARKGDKIARGYSMPYSELCEKILNDAQKMIGDSPIELIREGVVLL